MKPEGDAYGKAEMKPERILWQSGDEARENPMAKRR